MSAEESFVGIDISKSALDVHVEPAGQCLHVAYDEAGIAQVCARLKEISPTLIVMEATGGLETRLAGELAAHALPVAVVNARQVRDFARAAGQLAKTDSLDAAVLSAFARAMRPSVRPIKDALTREFDEMVSRRRQLVQMRVQEQLRLHTASKVQAKSLKAHIAWLDKNIVGLDENMGKRLRSCEIWRVKDDLLQSIPGVASVTSRSMLGGCPELGGLDRRAIAKLVGVAPLNHDSGKHRGQRHIWGGRADLRSVLYMATLSAMRCNPLIRPFAQRLKQAGKPKKVVIVACMRKLLTIMNAILRTNTPWSPRTA